jgi:hypothetical protein
MNKREQLLNQLKNPYLETWQREAVHQHLFHLEQTQALKREASTQKKEHYVRKNFKHDDTPKPTPTET